MTHSQQLILKAQGGEMPYQWMINGVLAKQNLLKHTWQWQVPAKGQYQLTLVDNNGEQQSSRVWIE